jgi:hypothetical protein
MDSLSPVPLRIQSLSPVGQRARHRSFWPVPSLQLRAPLFPRLRFLLALPRLDLFQGVPFRRLRFRSACRPRPGRP